MQPRMPHPARHSRPKARQQEDQHALGSLLEEVGSRRAPAAHRLGEEHAERAEHAQQHPEATAPPMTLRRDGAHATLTAPNRGAQQMVLGASPRAVATWRGPMLRAHDATDPHVAVRPLDAPATCCGRTSDVPHEAYGTGTALGGALLGDAATCRGSSSHMHAAYVSEHDETGVQAPASACTAAEPDPPPDPQHTTPMEMMVTLNSTLLTTDTLDEDNLLQLMSQLQMAQNIVVQRFQVSKAQRQSGHVFAAAAQPLVTNLI